MIRKIWLFALFGALLVVPHSSLAQQQQWSLGYWTPWGNPALSPTAIEWGGLTHVVHAWALVQPDGTLDLSTQRISADGPTLIANAHAHGVKAILGVGQAYWQGQTTNLQSAITSNRAALINNIMSVVDSYGFDGVDMDWEPFSAGTNGSALQAWAADMRSRLGTSRTLSAAAIVTDYKFWGSVQTYFDRIGVMTYDMTGTWNPYSWHNAALYDPDGQVWSVDLAIKRFTANGVPAGKLSVGIPFFGYRWTGGGITGPRQNWVSTPSVSQVYYQNFASTINSTNYRWDSAAAVPYLSTDNSGTTNDQFLTYDDEQSVVEKMHYAQNHGLGGWIIWELNGDYLPAQTPNQPLLTAIKNARGGSAPVGDTTPPSVTINQSSGQADPTSSTSIAFTVTFSEPVSGFTASDVAVTGSAPGIKSVALSGSGPTFTATIGGVTGSGTVIVTIPAGVVADAAGNVNTASTSADNTVSYILPDITPPSVTVNQSSGQADATSALPIAFTVVFSEPVSGFTASDVAVTGSAPGIKSVALSGSGPTFTATIGGVTGSGTVIVTIPAGVVADAAGNVNTASTSADNTVSYILPDITPPSVTVNQSSGQADATSALPIAFTVVFSEPVSGFVASDVAVGGTAPGNKSVGVSGSGTTFTVTVGGATDSGTVVVTIPAGVVADAAGNLNLASTSADNTVTYIAPDITPPSVTVNQSSGQADATGVLPIAFTVVFSEPVSGFAASDVAVGGTAPGTKSVGVSGSGTAFTVTVGGVTDSGTVVVTIPAGVVADAAGNLNLASTSADNTVTYVAPDTTPPSVTINQSPGQADPTSALPIAFTVVFSEPVSGFTASDVAVGGTAPGAKSVTLSGSGTTFTMTIGGVSGSGTVIPTIPAGGATDAAGNANTASTSADNTVAFAAPDTVPPSVTINQSSGQADPTSTLPIAFTVVFSEPVSGFTAGDVTVGGTASGTKSVTLSGSGTTFTATIDGVTGNGTVIVTIPAGVVSDSSGNPNLASTSADNVVTFTAAGATSVKQWSMGYWTPAGNPPLPPDQIEWGGLTHVIHAWALVQPNGALDLDTEGVSSYGQALVAAAHAHGVKALLGVGQPFWLGQTGNLLQATNSYQATLTNNIMSVVDTYGFDGVDIDWRPFNTSTDGPAARLLAADLRARLGSRILTASAIVTDSAYWSTAYSVFDRLNLITYSLTGTWNPYSWHNAALYDPDNQVWSVDLAVRRFIQAGVPASTMTIGIPFFGYLWTGGGITGPQQIWSSTPTLQELDYQGIAPSINSGAYRQDGLARVPYLTSPSSFLTYDDEDSIKGKMDYVVAQGIGGWTIWELAGDYLPSQTPNQPLLTAIMNRTGKPPRTPTPPSVTINRAPGQGDPTFNTTIHFRVVFSEPVTGFTAADVTIGGTSGGRQVSITGNGAIYDVAVTGMTASGNVTASIAAGVAVDGEGDPNSASTSTDNTVRFKYRR